MAAPGEGGNQIANARNGKSAGECVFLMCLPYCRVEGRRVNEYCCLNGFVLDYIC